MTWKPISQEDVELCIKMRTWIEIARKSFNNPTWLPTDSDIYKSALLERLRNGLEPLAFPPPLGYSCPWYALIDDKQPHLIGDGSNIDHPNKLPRDRQSWNEVCFDPWITGTVYIFQSTYDIVEQSSLEDYILKDHVHDTAYRFRLYFDKDFRLNKAGLAYNHGAWFIQFLGTVAEIMGKNHG